jgi:DNA-binding response OmpR family regulator
VADYQKRCDLLTKENDDLRDRVAQLEEALGMAFDSPAFMGLSGNEAKLFGLLMSREAVTKSGAMDVLYGLSASDGDIAEEKIVDVFLCKLRKKLDVFEIPIETNWGQGYFMTEHAKQKARTLIEQHRGLAS